MFPSASQRPFYSICGFMPSAHRLANVVAGVRLEVEGCGDRVTEWISPGQHSNLCLWRGVF